MRIPAAWIACLAAALVSGHGVAQPAYPGKPVRMLVGFPAGTNPDLIARDVAKSLSDAWGQPVVVVNRPGAGGVLATESVAQAEPDGLTLYLTSGSAFVSAPFLYRKLGYDPLTGLTPIALVAENSLALVTPASGKAKTFQEFVTAARAAPGTLTYGSFGVGSLHHVSMEKLQRATGIRLVHVPYGSNGPLSDLLAGGVDSMWSSLQVAGLIESGKLNAIAYSGLKRNPKIPNVPTVSEMGYPGFESLVWFGVVGPPGVPVTIVRKIQNDIDALASTPAFQRRMAELGNDGRFLGAEDFRQLIHRDFAANKTLFEALKIEKQ